MARDSYQNGDRVRDVILAFVERYQSGVGYPPAMRDIADGVGIPVSSVKYHLTVLQNAGLVSSEPNKARTLRILT